MTIMMINLTKIVEALEASWGLDTTLSPSDWSTDNPSRGQCVVSSLIVQDYLGGELLRYSVDGENLHEIHYFNQLDDGTYIDTTINQYKIPITLKLKPISLDGFNSVREKRLSGQSTAARYELLKERVDKYLQLNFSFDQ